MNDTLRSAHILIVDDEPANLLLLERLLAREGFTSVAALANSAEVAATVAAAPPDLILLDLHMPRYDGFAVLSQIQPWLRGAAPVPVIVLTADTTPKVRHRALELGAKDFLTKPFDSIEVMLRIRHLLETRALQVSLAQTNARLEDMVRDRTRQLEDAQVELLAHLALTAEYRDDDTGLHAQRVGRMAQQIAAILGLSPADVDLIARAAPLHDIGKIGIPDRILLKPGPLTAEEYELIKDHTTIGANILANSRFRVLQVAEEIALSHHERWDGAGYPRGLRGEAIPLSGRIVAVADAFDVMTHARPYKQAMPVAAAVAELRGKAGSQFDPTVIEAWLAVVQADSWRHPLEPPGMLLESQLESQAGRVAYAMGR